VSDSCDVASGGPTTVEIQEALKIMRALADGVSRETGEVLTSELV
jgi:hypothetical protein